MKNIPSLGIQIPDILLPKSGTDLSKWAVIACDQYTSEPEYWQQVENIVGDSPSTYNMILPEVMLGTEVEIARIQSTQAAMQKYLDEDLFIERQGFILVERQASNKTRHGLILALDLEKYDFNKGSQTLIRASEGTIIERLPPRIRIREGAILELPHILVLIDDPNRSVIEPVIAARENIPLLYDFDLMLGSGHLRGYWVNDGQLENKIVRAFETLADPQFFSSRYSVKSDLGVLLFAMGDGNHSLATAKSIWEMNKSKVGMNHPSRYALVEIENIHDEGLVFEPIHRVVFNVKSEFLPAFEKFFNGAVSVQSTDSLEHLIKSMKNQTRDAQNLGMITPSGFGVLSIQKPISNLPVGSLQAFLDNWQGEDGFERIDYVHGEEILARLGSQSGNIGFLLPAMEKNELFKTVILDGVLPRKTFSMGAAQDKRFYMECRKIK
jgi:hypothetical protein